MVNLGRGDWCCFTYWLPYCWTCWSYSLPEVIQIGWYFSTCYLPVWSASCQWPEHTAWICVLGKNGLENSLLVPHPDIWYKPGKSTRMAKESLVFPCASHVICVPWGSARTRHPVHPLYPVSLSGDGDFWTVPWVWQWDGNTTTCLYLENLLANWENTPRVYELKKHMVMC